ncbi:MAG: adenylosuccinate synthase [Chlamydiales bacterium]|nr:adenylosuccinate synthase [Chlamydiales bacterium]
MTTVMVVGGQWGDEGKGKFVDLLAAEAKHVIRAQGGANAGHTIVIGHAEYKLHLVPSGILETSPTCYLGAGVVLDPAILLDEIEMLAKAGIKVKGRFWISSKAHLVMPYHKLVDKLSGGRIGTTGRGIGPCYADKTLRIGIRVGDLINAERFKTVLQQTLAIKNLELEKIYNTTPIAFDTLYNEYIGYAKQLAPYIADVEQMIMQARQKNENILLEGAQGTLLDNTFGSYPFVTSSSTCASGICLSAGLGPKHINHTLVILKAYCTRVGLGPFPTEDPTVVKADHVTIREIGTTTGRKRRLGWFDAVMANWAVQLNGADGIAITKLDILDDVEEIKICSGYRLDGNEIHYVPCNTDDLARVEPIYETMPGWKQPTCDLTHYDQLPAAAKAYLKRIADLSGIPIVMISVGPERSQTLIISSPFANKEPL